MIDKGNECKRKTEIEERKVLLLQITSKQSKQFYTHRTETDTTCVCCPKTIFQEVKHQYLAINMVKIPAVINFIMCLEVQIIYFTPINKHSLTHSLFKCCEVG